MLALRVWFARPKVRDKPLQGSQDPAMLQFWPKNSGAVSLMVTAFFDLQAKCWICMPIHPNGVGGRTGQTGNVLQRRVLVVVCGLAAVDPKPTPPPQKGVCLLWGRHPVAQRTPLPWGCWKEA